MIRGGNCIIVRESDPLDSVQHLKWSVLCTVARNGAFLLVLVYWNTIYDMQGLVSSDRIDYP
jgi:hypothetical protein